MFKSILYRILFSLLAVSAIADDYLISHGTQGLFSKVNINIIDAIYQPTDVTPTHIFEPQVRSLASANSGKANAALFSSKNNIAQYDQLIALDKPHYQVDIHTFSTEDIVINSWQDLANYKIAYLAGFVVAKKQTVGMNRIETKSLQQALQLLDAYRVDIVIATVDSGLEIINSWPQTNIVMQDEPIQTIPLYHFVHQQHQTLIDQLNASLAAQLENGRISEIIQKTRDAQ